MNILRRKTCTTLREATSFSSGRVALQRDQYIEITRKKESEKRSGYPSERDAPHKMLAKAGRI
jgi:hypothetical protein